MGRKHQQLTVKAIENKRKPGFYCDGGNLYLQVSPALTKSWVFRYTVKGKTRDMGLGPLRLVPLAEAREKARDASKLLLQGIDPIEARDAHRQGKALDAARRRPVAAGRELRKRTFI
jgi:hypothetical protein